MKIGISNHGMVSAESWKRLLSTITNNELFQIYPAMQEDNLDLIIFDGGQDISPELYNEKSNYKVFSFAQRDAHEVQIFNKFINSDTMFVGICRGLQLLNALLGGNLIQDLHTEGFIQHHYHTVTVQDDTDIRKYIPEKEFIVNSIHHQAAKVLGNNCVATLIDNQGVIEGIETLDGKVRAVQCHPEMGSFKHAETLLKYLFRL